MTKSLATVAAERIEQAILVIRGERVILDSDLAKLYRVTTARLNQQVRRNTERFPDDFMFGLTKEEYGFFDVAICNIKRRTRRPAQIATRLYRTRRDHGSERAQQ